MPSYPLHLDLTGRRVLVVGAGPVAVRRLRALVEAGAAPEVVALETPGDLGVPLHRRKFRPTDVDGAWLVLACTGVVDDEVAAACEQRGTWCVRADDASTSAAWLPAVARVDDLVVGVTAGRDPRRSVAVRDAIALAVDSGQVPLRRARAGAGSLALVGGGPGEPGLLTVRGRQLLAGADVVVRDRLAPQVELADGVEVVEVDMHPHTASCSHLDIEQLLVSRAAEGRRVVRLTVGDLHQFAPASKAAAACRDAGIAVEVIPGVSSTFAAPDWAARPAP